MNDGQLSVTLVAACACCGSDAGVRSNVNAVTAMSPERAIIAVLNTVLIIFLIFYLTVLLFFDRYWL